MTSKSDITTSPFDERVYTTMYEILTDLRGYTVDSYTLETISKCGGEFTATNGGDEADGDGEAIHVFFNESDNKVGVHWVRECIKKLKEMGADGILVVKDDLTSSAKTDIAAERDLSIEYFRSEELLVNKTKHVLVPRHRVLSQQEKASVLKMCGEKSFANFPCISIDDPIAKYFRPSRGDVFEITRKTETATDVKVYRRVV